MYFCVFKCAHALSSFQVEEHQFSSTKHVHSNAHVNLVSVFDVTMADTLLAASCNNTYLLCLKLYNELC